MPGTDAVLRYRWRLLKNNLLGTCAQHTVHLHSVADYLTRQLLVGIQINSNPSHRNKKTNP